MVEIAVAGGRVEGHFVLAALLHAGEHAQREDLAHTGAHKINNALGQAVIARRLGKQRIVAETGAGQHGVATATACALLGLDCHVYMGSEDMDRQALNVFRMRLLGAEVVRVDAGLIALQEKSRPNAVLLGALCEAFPFLDAEIVREALSEERAGALGEVARESGRVPPREDVGPADRQRVGEPLARQRRSEDGEVADAGRRIGPDGRVPWYPFSTSVWRAASIDVSPRPCVIHKRPRSTAAPSRLIVPLPYPSMPIEARPSTRAFVTKCWVALAAACRSKSSNCAISAARKASTMRLAVASADCARATCS